VVVSQTVNHPQSDTTLSRQFPRKLEAITNPSEAVQIAIDEFHACEEARQHGYHYDTARLQQLEAKTILRYLPKGGVLLDVGTGSGVIPRAAQLMGAEVHSVDFPKTGGTEALARLMGFGIAGYYAEFGRDQLPIADGSVDVVFCGNIIEHLIHTPRHFLRECKRLLKSGGHLVVDTKNAVDLKTRLKLLCGISNWPAIEGVYENEFNYFHHKEYTLEELARAVELSGFEVRERVAEEVFFHRSLRRLGSVRLMGGDRRQASEFGTGFNPLHPYEYARVALLALTRAMPNLRSDILVVGRKPR
jgi:2-polyprenyl-3-methyl-5-hydroxy-6-metoxy-1,4-benzoquinol methylase